MAITNYWSTATSYTSTQPGWVTTPATTDFDKDPAVLAPEIFQAWSRAKQLEYIAANASAGDPNTIYLGGPPPDPDDPSAPVGTKVQIVADAALQLRVGTSSGEAFTVEGSGRAALASEKALAPSALDPDIFLSWRAEDRQAYLLAKGTGTPKSITVGSGTPTPSIYAVATSDIAIGAGVIQRTPGDYEPIPYFELSGSANGTPSSVIATSAEWLFPSLDGVNEKLPVEERPEMFYVDVTTANDAKKTQFLADFAKWHSAYQLEYIKAHGTNVTVGSVTVKKLDIVVGTPAARLTAIVSPDDPTKHFIVQALDKAAIARMTLAEQSAIVATGSAFTDMAASLGLSLTTTASLSGAANKTNGGSLSGSPTGPFTATGYVDELIYDLYHTSAPNNGGSTLPTEATDPFNTQLKILKEQIANSAIVSPGEIKKKVDELRDRFNRLFAFFNVRPSKAETWYHNNPDDNSQYYTVTVYADVISTDASLTNVNRGYQVFLAQEKRIAELADGRMKLVRSNGVLGGKNLDVPYLVYKFQSLYNLSLEAQVVAETEEVNQQNDLLKIYAAIQDIINRTLSSFPKADETKKSILGYGVTGTESLSDADIRVLSMFEDALSGSHRAPDGTFVGGLKHPMEVLRGIKRPTFDFFYNPKFGQHNVQDHDGIDADGQNGDDDDDTYTNRDMDLNEYTHTQWSTYGTRLSETVTLINQNSQIKMNDINSMDKERNRHFELANGALSKMADIIANIARASG